jgi:hypothetical protein
MSTLGKTCRGKLVRPGYLEIDVSVEFDSNIEGAGNFTSPSARYELDGSYVLLLDDGQVLVVNVDWARQDSKGACDPAIGMASLHPFEERDGQLLAITDCRFSDCDRCKTHNTPA